LTVFFLSRDIKFLETDTFNNTGVQKSGARWKKVTFGTAFCSLALALIALLLKMVVVSFTVHTNTRGKGCA